MPGPAARRGQDSSALCSVTQLKRRGRIVPSPSVLSVSVRGEKPLTGRATVPSELERGRGVMMGWGQFPSKTKRLVQEPDT